MGNTEVSQPTTVTPNLKVVPVARKDAAPSVKKEAIQTAVKEKVAKEPKEVPTVYVRCHKQYEVWKAEKQAKTDSVENLKKFIVDCRNGWPNGRPKTVESLRLKYRGIVHTLKALNPELDFPPSTEILGS